MNFKISITFTVSKVAKKEKSYSNAASSLVSAVATAYRLIAGHLMLVWSRKSHQKVHSLDFIEIANAPVYAVIGKFKFVLLFLQVNFITIFN